MSVSPSYVIHSFGRWTELLIEPRGTFALFACACFGAYLWATHLVPETGGVALEEMDAVFGGETGKTDSDLRKEVCETFQSGWEVAYKDMAD